MSKARLRGTLQQVIFTDINNLFKAGERGDPEEIHMLSQKIFAMMTGMAISVGVLSNKDLITQLVPSLLNADMHFKGIFDSTMSEKDNCDSCPEKGTCKDRCEPAFAAAEETDPADEIPMAVMLGPNAGGHYKN